METIALKFDDLEVKAQSVIQKHGNETTIFLSYEAEDGEKVEAHLLKDAEGWLIRETSPHRELYLSLSFGHEEGYLKTPLGMIVFETELQDTQITENSLKLIYHLIQNDVVEKKELELHKNL